MAEPNEMYTVGHYRLTSETSYGTGGQILGRYWSAFICLQGSFFRKVFNATHSFSVSICAGSHLSVLIIIAAYYQICVFKEGVCFKIRYV